MPEDQISLPLLQLLQISCYLCFRHGPHTATLIQPVREVGMRELALLCHYQGLPVVAPLNHAAASSKPSINTLSEQFVARLQANVPSSVSTILRTACKLQVNRKTVTLWLTVLGTICRPTDSRLLEQNWLLQPLVCM